MCVRCARRSFSNTHTHTFRLRLLSFFPHLSVHNKEKKSIFFSDCFRFLVMNYFDFNNQNNPITSTTMQPLPSPPPPLPPTMTTNNAPAVVNQQPPKDLSDWRNIQVGGTSPMFDPFWLPQTPVTPWTTSNQTVYPSPYHPVSSSSTHPYQWTHPNYNAPWKFPDRPTQSFGNFNHPETMNNPTVNPTTTIRFDPTILFNRLFSTSL